MISKVRLINFNSEKGLDRGTNKVKEVIWYFVKIIFFLSAIPYPSQLKIFLLKSFGAIVGHGIIIKPRVNIHFPWKLEIGNDVWIGEEVFLLNFEKLKIGNNVCISQRAFICGGNHDYLDPTMPYRNGSIYLMDGCWIGANSFVGPNVEVGTDTVVSVNSIISKSIPGNAIYAGNPAHFIKQRWNQ
jgi:putative colanic acid biosynthesis acetyltransferase WcaF